MKNKGQIISLIGIFALLVLSPLLSYATLENDTVLVGWWKFDEGGGTTAADSSGNGNNGTLVNNPLFT